MTSSRSSPVKKSFLLAFLLGIGIAGCLGYSMVISGSSEYAERNKPFTLTCTVNDAVGLTAVVVAFYKGSYRKLIGALSQLSSCSVFSEGSPGYVVACGTGTDTSTSSTKTYTLTISNVEDDDAISWFCGLRGTGTRSDSFIPKINDPTMSTVISTVLDPTMSTVISTVLDPTMSTVISTVLGDKVSEPPSKSDTWCIRYSILNTVLIVGGVIISF